MTYYVRNQDGTVAITLADGVLETNTSLTLVGKNYPTYGEIFNQNFYNLLHNFAYTTEPQNAVIGQIWFDAGNLALKVYRPGADINYWQPLAHIVQSSLAPANTEAGDLWWDTINYQLKIRNNNAWVTIGPQVTNPGELRTDNPSFVLQVQGTETLLASSNGQVNFPYNAVFQGTLRKNNFGAASFVGSGLGSYDVFVPVNKEINISAAWQETGIISAFVCPADGIYEVSGWMQTLGGASGYDAHSIMFWQNQFDTNIRAQNNHPVGQSHTLSVHGYLKCAAGDTLQFVYSADADAEIADQNSGFSIRLAG